MSRARVSAFYAFTKEVVQLETQSYFNTKWKDKNKKEILSGFDAVLKKVRNRPAPDWDKI
jgi:hypothetical protein